MPSDLTGPDWPYLVACDDTGHTHDRRGNVVREENHQTLEVFLRRLLAALERDGNSDAVVVMAWKSVMAGALQPVIKTVEHYRAAWIACSTAADIITTLDDFRGGGFGSPVSRTGL